MHNIDRTNLESNFGEYTQEFEYETDEFGYEFEGEQEYYGETYAESPFGEAEEMALAAELLSVSNEAELDQFLGKLIRSAGKAIGKVVKSPVGKALGGILKGAAKQALPILGGAAGNFLLPGVGGAIGSKLASGLGAKFGLELEGLSQEDQEFELARQVVRLGGAATANAAGAPPSTPPQQAAQAATVAAAQQYAPGLLQANQAGTGKARANGRRGCQHKKSGQWFRRGNMIVIVGG